MPVAITGVWRYLLLKLSKSELRMKRELLPDAMRPSFMSRECRHC
jgi:hypothetical protein